MALTALSGGSFLGIAVTFTNTSGPPFLGVHGGCATAYDKLYFDDGGGRHRDKFPVRLCLKYNKPHI